MSSTCRECRRTYSWESGRFSKTQWMKGDDARCKSCVTASGSVGGHTGDGFGGFVTVRNNSTERYAQADAGKTTASVNQTKLHAHGAFKDVFPGVYTSGSRKGEDCVFKKFRTGVSFRADYFDKDVEAAKRAAQLIQKFNDMRLSRVKIRLNIPEVVATGEGRNKTKWLLEPFVHNWEKFNSNTGWSSWSQRNSVTHEVMQALSHFSYHASSGMFLLCDLQGGIYRDGVILSDPIIISRTAEQYGGGDLGPKGFSTFFNRHRCNDFCERHWQIPRDCRAYFEEEEGSSLLGNRGIPQQQYLHTLGALDEEDEYSEDDSYYYDDSDY